MRQTWYTIKYLLNSAVDCVFSDWKKFFMIYILSKSYNFAFFKNEALLLISYLLKTACYQMISKVIKDKKLFISGQKQISVCPNVRQWVTFSNIDYANGSNYLKFLTETNSECLKIICSYKGCISSFFLEIKMKSCLLFVSIMNQIVPNTSNFKEIIT